MESTYYKWIPLIISRGPTYNISGGPTYNISRWYYKWGLRGARAAGTAARCCPGPGRAASCCPAPGRAASYCPAPGRAARCCPAAGTGGCWCHNDESAYRHCLCFSDLDFGSSTATTANKKRTFGAQRMLKSTEQ